MHPLRMTRSQRRAYREGEHMALLTKQQILAAEDIHTEMVAVPEWGGDVLVRGLSGAERDLFEDRIIVREGKKKRVELRDVRAKLAAICMVDEQGARLFSDAEVASLTRKSAAALQRVFEAAQRLSGLTDDDVEELEKNSGSGPAADSPSA